MNNTITWQCTDCTIGETKPCLFIAHNPDSQLPVSCPYGTHGEDAEWTQQLPIERE
jgi:hypothetical protein